MVCGLQIPVFLDLEAVVPPELAGALRAYRLIQVWGWNETRAILPGCESQWQTTLTEGEGIFWHRRWQEIVPVEKVLARWEISSFPIPSFEVDLALVQTIPQYRGMLAAVRLYHLQQGLPYLIIQRDGLASELGISVPTLQRYCSAGYIQRMQRMRPSENYRPEKGEKWWLVNGRYQAVRQEENAYSSMFMDKLDEYLVISPTSAYKYQMQRLHQTGWTTPMQQQAAAIQMKRAIACIKASLVDVPF